MVNRSKQKGTNAETAQVNYLRQRGAPHAERRTQAGAHDKGDIAGLPGVVIESKACKTYDLGGWLAEAHKERDNAAPLIPGNGTYSWTVKHYATCS